MGCESGFVFFSALLAWVFLEGSASGHGAVLVAVLASMTKAAMACVDILQADVDRMDGGASLCFPVSVDRRHQHVGVRRGLGAPSDVAIGDSGKFESGFGDGRGRSCGLGAAGL
jgi:hypothetical protein